MDVLQLMGNPVEMDDLGPPLQINFELNSM